MYIYHLHTLEKKEKKHCKITVLVGDITWCLARMFRLMALATSVSIQESTGTDKTYLGPRNPGVYHRLFIWLVVQPPLWKILVKPAAVLFCQRRRCCLFGIHVFCALDAAMHTNTSDKWHRFPQKKCWNSARWISILLNWLVVWTPLKNISQLGWLFLIYGKIKNVPNHQPVIIFLPQMSHVQAISSMRDPTAPLKGWGLLALIRPNWAQRGDEEWS